MSTWTVSLRHLIALLGLAVQPILIAGTPRSNGVPRPDHVVVVIEENRSFDQIANTTNAPYIHSLMERGALLIASHAIRHPSQPNYIALFSGSTHRIGDDDCVSSLRGDNIGSELFRAGLTFTGYSESMPRVGFRGCSSGGYERKHNPWVNFTNVPPTANQPFTNFPADFAQLPTVSIVVPNQRNDMHDGSIGQGDRWLETHIGPYIDWAMTNNSLFLLTWDEGKKGSDNRIFTLLVGEMVQPGIYADPVDHYTVLRTLLEMYELTPMAFATNRDPITSLWKEGAARSPVEVTLTQPSPDATYPGPASLSLVADATSTSGSITRVEFFERGRFLGEATSAPFVLNVSAIAPGEYYFVAKATDALGQRKTSATVPVHVFDPFPAVQGNYQGLIYDTNGVTPETSGFLTLTLSPKGTFTAQARVGTRTVRMSGAFDGTGSASALTRLPAPLSGPGGASNFLLATLNLDLTNGTDRLQGTISQWSVDGSGAVLASNAVASFYADRATFSTSGHPTPLAGRYTLLLPGTTNGLDSPGGDGCGAVTVRADGQVRVTGYLADGTTLSAGAGLAKDGRWPFYVPIQKGAGALIGWIQFTNAVPQAAVELGGCLTWIQPAAVNPRGKVHPDGFATVTCVRGSGYTAATNTAGRILEWTAGMLRCEGGNLATPLTNSLQLQARGAITSADRRSLTLRITEKTGLWQGKFLDPATKRQIPMRGAVWQSQDTGAGFFLGTNRTGRALLEAE